MLLNFLYVFGGSSIDLLYPIGSMYIHGAAIYGNMDPINIPQMLAYIPAPWILWVLYYICIYIYIQWIEAIPDSDSAAFLSAKS
jgi:hypothetical protein